MTSAGAQAGLALGGPLATVEAPLQQFVVRARDGDRDAFATLYRARVAGVARYVGAIVRDVDRTDDVIAQTFLLAWRDLPKLRRPERFDAWLLRIARNQARSALRRQTDYPLDQASEPPDPSPFTSPSAVFERKSDTERVRAALLQFPKTQREVLVLRFFRELSHAEVAEQTGRTVGAARALQYRALGSLRDVLETDER